jgi:hypothetical protein
MGDSVLQIASALEIGKNSLHNEKMVEPFLKENVIHHYADQMPAFPGGDKELRKFLARNLKVPEQSVFAGTKYKGRCSICY